MNLRLRFVIILTLVVSLILIISIISIYFLFSDARNRDYQKRLWAEAYVEYINYYHIKEIDKSSAEELQNYYPANLADIKTIFIADSGKILFTIPDTLHYVINRDLLAKIKPGGKYFFNDGKNEAAGLYFNISGRGAYVIVSSYDKFGIARLNKLRLIMFFVALGAIIIIGIFSLFYVIHTTGPLVKLSAQMRHITENNLTQRFKVRREKAGGNEIVQMALNFNTMLDRLQQAFEMQRSFVHHASHELRTPLASMLAQTESALKKEMTPAEAKEVLQSLKEDQHDLIDLTNALLMLSQYERVFYSSDWPLLRIDEILYDSISVCKRMFPNMNINVEFLEIPGNESNLMVKGNENLLRSAFRNLIKNAFQYSDDKKISVLIKTTTDNINLYFENHGKTLKPADAEKLFLPFFRGENAQKKKGFGLGLSIVERILLLHNATIQYEAADNDINRFHVLFARQ